MIHKYKALGLNIVMDVYSGVIHAVDDLVYDMLDHIKDVPEEDKCPGNIVSALSGKYSAEEIDEAYEEICGLCENETLFTKDMYSGIAKNWNKKSNIKALCMHITHDCNLRCKYCFADTGAFHGERSMMSKEVGEKAVDFVIRESGARKNIEIDYFGGEPLLNFDTVRHITEYARKKGEECGKNFRFTITTNGVLLNDEVISYINENMSNVVLSLDGRKEVNDRMRYRADGSGSYADIVPKYKKLVESRGDKDYYIRGTFTAENTDFADDVMHMLDLGFKNTSIEPVVVPEDKQYAVKKEDLPAVFAEYDKLARIYYDKRKNGEPFTFFHFMIDLEQGPCVVKRLSGCGAGHEYVAVTPGGDIYPCHQFVGNTDFKMGSVFGESIDEGIKEKFERSNVYTKPACENCFAKFYCSGGCSANAYNFNKDINKPYETACDMERKRVECAVAIEAKLALGDE
ncbi:MAG: thioether cross-link-forming SCIFF peptide maturase [Oscillospiraceae bacterium]|nr:thioether cross-link-forming SCIFF peptide maturase [Oscillospiraceae bacterium]